MANLLTSYVFDIMTNFFDILVDAMACFWRHSKFVDIMTCSWLHDTLLWHISDVMTNLVMSRRVFDVINVLWRVCDIMTNFLKYIALIDVMTNVLMSWKFWQHDTLFTSWRTTCFYIMTNLFVVMTYFCHYFGNKILCKCDFDIMTTFLMLWHALMSRQNI